MRRVAAILFAGAAVAVPVPAAAAPAPEPDPEFPLRVPALIEGDRFITYRMHVERFRLRVDYTMVDRAACEAFCMQSGSSVVTLAPGRGSAHMVLKKPRFRRGGGVLGVSRGTHTVAEGVSDEGEPCRMEKTPHHGEQLHWRLDRRLRVKFDLSSGNYFQVGCGPTADRLLAGTGVFPDRRFPRSLLRRRRFVLRFDAARTVMLGGYEIKYQQDVVLRLTRRASYIYEE